MILSGYRYRISDYDRKDSGSIPQGHKTWYYIYTRGESTMYLFSCNTRNYQNMYWGTSHLFKTYNNRISFLTQTYIYVHKATHKNWNLNPIIFNWLKQLNNLNNTMIPRSIMGFLYCERLPRSIVIQKGGKRFSLFKPPARCACYVAILMSPGRLSNSTV
jgi:hypothetical protein